MTPEHPSDPPLQTVDVPGGVVRLTDEGAGPALVCLHGMPGSPRDFRWLAPAMPGLRTIRVALPGVAGSTPVPRPDPVALAAVVPLVADALKLDVYAVLGHSLGGAVATAVAVADPRVRALVLVSAVGTRPHRGYRSLSGWSWSLLDLALGTPARTVLVPRIRAIYRRFGFPSSITDDELVTTIRAAARVRFPEHAARLARVAVPTLVAWTEDDKLIEATIFEELAALVPAGPRLRFPDGGHNPQKSHAVEIGAAISALLLG